MQYSLFKMHSRIQQRLHGLQYRRRILPGKFDFYQMVQETFRVIKLLSFFRNFIPVRFNLPYLLRKFYTMHILCERKVPFIILLPYLPCRLQYLHWRNLG